MAADVNKFNVMCSLVIEKLEGGYYHPDMLKDGRVKDSRYSNSGETMFGIDRKAGGKINLTPEGVAFWKIIDAANARKIWPWNFKGGALAPELKKYADAIMYREYERLTKMYLSPAAKAIVDADNRLLFHFIYGAWNGSGWFKKFATDINTSVANGVINPDKLIVVAINSRTKEGLKAGSPPNSLVAQGGNKIAAFINELKETVSNNKASSATGIVLLALGLTALYFKDDIKQLI
jgi:hypothetical protein